MKKSTKILLIVFIVFLIPSIILGRYVFSAIGNTDGVFTFDFNAYSISGLALIVGSFILGNILFVRFIKSLAFDRAIFFSSIPLVIVYGLAMFGLSGLVTYQNDTAKTVTTLLNISAENNYNTILWAVLITLVFMIILFVNYFILCRPVGRVERIVARLGDGKIREDKIKVGGIEQFHNIEHSLNKINNNYREKDSSLKNYKIESEKYVPKQFIKFLGRGNISQLELGKQVKKTATTMLIKLVGLEEGKMSLEENFQFVNSYLHTVAPLISRCDGFIDKYLGEGLLAVFPSPQKALDCVGLLSRAVEIKNRQNKTLPKISLRATITCGEVAFGVVGEENHKIPTIVSDAMVALEKMDEIAKLIHTKILFSKRVLDQLPLEYKFAYRFVGSLSCKDEKVLLFENLEVVAKDQQKLLLKTKSIFEKGVMLYENGQWEKAEAYFEEILKSNSADRCAYVYFNKCKEKIA